MRRSPSTHFDLVSHWRVAATRERVWAVLTDPEGWPGWWPFVRDVHTLRAGDADGLGSLRRIRWATRLPYQLVIDVEAIELRRPERLRARSQGQLRGEGLWLLRSDGAHTDITYVWRVELTQAWMRALAPLLAPLFRWNHAAVMRAGEAGLQRLLAAGPAAPVVQAAHTSGTACADPQTRRQPPSTSVAGTSSARAQAGPHNP